MAADPNEQKLTTENFGTFLAAFIKRDSLVIRSVAGSIGCSENTLARVLVGKTRPTSRLMTQGAILVDLGFPRFRKLSRAECEKISEAIRAVSGTGLGFASVTAAISSLGIPGLSATGISSGLAALGEILGEGMAAGIVVAAALPISAGVLGWAVIKGIKYVISEARLDSTHIDQVWETIAD